MPRPKKWRKVCCMPRSSAFAPVDGSYSEREAVVILLDEYESIRLIDHQGFTQEECGRYMHIARSTVQQIYNDARKKLALVLVEGRSLRIGGGEYRLCDGSEAYCGCGGCGRHRFEPMKEVKGDMSDDYCDSGQ